MSLPERAAAPSAAEPISDVLERVRAELEDIARRIDSNQALIAKSTWDAGANDADYVKAMQDADLSSQRIAGIAGFLRLIGDAAHPNWRVDTGTASGTLTLTELIRTIGSAGSAIEPKDKNDAGAVDFF
jgi:hypothetical protein